MSNYDPEIGGAACPIFRKKGKRAVVLCNGPQPPRPLLDYWLGGADHFVCADAAGHPYDHLPRVPDVVIGDFDSLSGRVLDGRDGPKFLQVADQYTTDSEKALLYVESQGYEEVILMGATGWRLDHTLYNVQLLERFAGKLRILLAGHHADTVRLGPGDHVSWDLSPGVLFSVIPMCGKVTGVTFEGAMYPLLGESLEPGGPATISNRVTMSPLLITVGEGSLLVAVDRESGPEYIEDIFEDD